MPGPSRSITTNIPLRERCVISLLLPKALLNDIRERQLNRDPHHKINRVLITINTVGELAVLVDIHKNLGQSSAKELMPAEEDDLNNLV